jgi:hypothetical protein
LGLSLRRFRPNWQVVFRGGVFWDMAFQDDTAYETLWSGNNPNLYRSKNSGKD